MKKKELEQIIPLKLEIKDLKNKVYLCSEMSELLVPGKLAEGISEKGLVHMNYLEALQKRLIELIGFIQNVDDSLVRQILRYRFIEGMSYIKIAQKTGYYDESVPRKKIEKFLKLSELPEQSEKKAV